jgi:hypothetical protein
MVKQHRSKWAILAMPAVAVVVVLTLTSGALAAGKCQRVEGWFTLQPVSEPACMSAVGVCATGTYRGDLKGDSTFTGTSLTPTMDTPTTAVVLLTGDNLIQTARGNLMTKDAIVLKTSGAGDFAEVDAIVGGTGAWIGVTGTIRAQGTFTTAAGGKGQYTGEICRP